MKLAGSHTIKAPRAEVWRALHDPAVLARTLPGCVSLEVTGPDRYAAVVNAGVASIQGTYSGEVELTQKEEPSRYVMRASGQGGPGTISADAVVTLEDEGDTTRIAYDADAVVGGMVGGVGQRVLTGVAKRTAGQFFDNVERDVLGLAPATTEAAAPEPPKPGGGEAGPAVGQVFAGSTTPAGADQTMRLVLAAVLGAAIALAGVLVGRRMTR